MKLSKIHILMNFVCLGKYPCGFGWSVRIEFLRFHIHLSARTAVENVITTIHQSIWPQEFMDADGFPTRMDFHSPLVSLWSSEHKKMNDEDDGCAYVILIE